MRKTATNADPIVKMGNSTIQHGKFNNRIYLMKLSRDDFPGIIENLDELALAKSYSKIFAKVPAFAKDAFLEKGYGQEAYIPSFYNGTEDVYFMGKYFDPARKIDRQKETLEKVLETTKAKMPKKEQGVQNRSQEQSKVESGGISLTSDFLCRMTVPGDVQQMAEVYQRIFATYPFPIDDPKYLLQTMEDNVVYFGIWEGKRLIALSSAEMDVQAENVEMTDFATLPEYQGKSLALYLLQEMEKEMARRGINTAYTIARAVSFGMNITFAKMGYEYSGTLINNTNISGNMESMNVWYKRLLNNR